MKLRSCKLFFLFFLVCVYAGFSQQTRESLEREKNENLNKIQEGQKILKETEIVKNATLGKLNVVKRQINSRVKFISNLKNEINYINKDVVDLNLVINFLERDLSKLKLEYGEMIYNSYKSNSLIISPDRLTVIFLYEPPSAMPPATLSALKTVEFPETVYMP